MPDIDPVELAKTLVRIDSQNPGPQEEECAQFCAGWLRERGFEVEVQAVAPGRPNLIAKLTGNGSQRPLVFLAHLDTVPAGDGWSHPPLVGEIHEGRLYGRGSSDMKGGLAAAMVAAAQLAEHRESLQGDMFVVTTVDEEGKSMLGAQALVKEKKLPPRALTVVPEPTGGRLRAAHVGAFWLEVVTSGKMAHAGKPWLGADANHAMAEVIRAVKGAIVDIETEHPILGRPQLTIGRVEGGLQTNVVPPNCRAEVDIRIVPPLTCDELKKRIGQAAKGACALVPGTSVTIEALSVERDPYQTNENSPLILALQDTYQEVIGKPMERGGEDGHEAFTDFSVLGPGLENFDGVVWGLGETNCAHAVDEWMGVDAIRDTAVILKKLGANVLGLPEVQ
jgi:succinyl-diaminopimelate desuccinylase